MKRSFKLSVQILLAATVLVVVVVCIMPGTARRSRSVPPADLAEFAKFVRQSCDPIQLQGWASNVVAGQAASPGSVIQLPNCIKQIPAPCAPWFAKLFQPARTNDPVVVELLSMGGFGSYSIIIGPQTISDKYKLSEMVADGIYVRRYP